MLPNSSRTPSARCPPVAPRPPRSPSLGQRRASAITDGALPTGRTQAPACRALLQERLARRAAGSAGEMQPAQVRALDLLVGADAELLAGDSHRGPLQCAGLLGGKTGKVQSLEMAVAPASTTSPKSCATRAILTAPVASISTPSPSVRPALAPTTPTRSQPAERTAVVAALELRE